MPANTRRKPAHDRFRVAELRASLQPMRLIFLPTVGSTSVYADRAIRAGNLSAPVIVIAARQTAGRGRAGPTWWTGSGCLAMTLATRPDPGLPAGEMSIRVAVAVAEAIGLQTLRLKWPNDLLIGRRKLGGILCQRTATCDLVGIGLNVNCRTRSAPRRIRGVVTSIVESEGRASDLTRLTAAIARSVFGAISPGRPSFRSVLDQYRARDALLKTRVQVELSPGRQLEGTAEGMDALGRLIVRCGKELHAIASGHVSSWSSTDKRDG